MSTSTTAKTPTVGKHPCGFHMTNHGENCRGACRNGDGSLVICPSWDGPPKCLECGSSEMVREDTWTCVDTEACASTVRTKVEANPTIRQLRAIQADLQAGEEPTARSTRPRSALGTSPAAPRVTSGECKCCGEPTKGGKFLPGHDSRYLSRLIEQFTDSTKRAAAEEPEDIRRLAHTISPAFGGKFDKRVGL